MTAPAAAHIPRRTAASSLALGSANAAPQPARQTRPAAQDTPANTGFAAHLEQSASSQPGSSPARTDEPRSAKAEASPLARPASHAPSTPEAATPAAATPAADAVATPAIEPATGKALPEKRQIPAGSTTQTMLALFTGQTGSDEDAAPQEAASSDETTTPETLTPVPALPLSLALNAAPAPAPAHHPASATALPPQVGTAARLAAAPQSKIVRPATEPVSAASSALSATASSAGQLPPAPEAASAGAALPQVTSAPTVALASLAFEAEGALAGPVLPPAIAVAAKPDDKPAGSSFQPASAQNAGRAEPSTFSALTGAAGTAETPTLKPRSDAEASQPAMAQLAADLPAAAILPQAQPATLQASTDPAAPASAQPAEGIGFDALVDSIARARDSAATGMADGAPVAVAMRHAEFGRVSLQFQAEANGLSVAMSSPDPAFAPAVAAARAAEVAAALPDTAQQNGSSANPGSEGTGGRQTQNSPQGNAQSSPQSQAGQGQAGQSRFSGGPARNTPQTAEAPGDDGRGGIFA